jgi:hypothetical protein
MTKAFKIDGVYCLLITLTQGQYAIVDATDFGWLSQWKWYAHWSECTQSFYASRNERQTNGKRITVFMHREILGLKFGDEDEGDHRSVESLDNRRKNLRVTARTGNMQNIRPQTNNKTGFKGVCLEKATGLYVAQIQKDGKRKKLGRRRKPEEAHELYRAAAREIYGEFARFE